MRTLRSKWDRNAIYYDYDGKCAECNKKIDKFHIDHIIPYSFGGSTLRSNLQLLCPSCNLKKGNKMPENLYKFRKHQSELIALLENLINEYKKTGYLEKDKISKFVFPGGGKSLDPIIAYKMLHEANIVDKVAIIVPRKALKEQGAEEFIKPELKKLFPHNYEIMEANSTPNPTKNTNGFIITYSALVTASIKPDKINPYIEDFKKFRYLLVLDEVHHTCCETKSKSKESINGFNFYKASKKLYDLAKFKLLLTGTPKRHLAERIGFFDYEQINDGNITPKLDIQYTYPDALADKAVVPIEYYIFGAKDISYTKKTIGVDADEEEHISRDSIKDGTDLKVALESDYGEKAMMLGIKRWQQNKFSNANSKIIVITHNQKHAYKYEKLFDSLGIEISLAISDNSDAHNAIARFRKNKNVTALVTCNMAHEGLDCKSATHVMALTNVRTKPYLEQAFTRSSRTDTSPGAIPYEDQKATIMVPDDPKMIKILEEWGATFGGRLEIEETEIIIEEARELEENKYEPFPISLLSDKSSDLGNETHTDNDKIRLDNERICKLSKVIDTLSLKKSPIELFKILTSAGIEIPANNMQYNESVTLNPLTLNNEEILLTPAKRRKKLSNDIEDFTRKLDYHLKREPGHWNKKILNKFRKHSRKSMDESQLQEVMRWLRKTAMEEINAKKNAKSISQ